MIEILSCALQNDICIFLTRSSFKVNNNLNDLNLSSLISNSAALLRQFSDEATERTFTINFQFDFILCDIEKLDEALLAICNQRSVDVRVKLIAKNKTFKRQIAELQDLYKVTKIQ